jgi:hypothetical protein
LKVKSLSCFSLGTLILFVLVSIMAPSRAGATVLHTAGSRVTFQNANSKLCIDTGGSKSFTYLIQSACSTNKSQQFTLVAAPASGWYYLSSTASNLCWDIWNDSSAPGALLQQYTCTAVSPEYYQLKAVSGGYEILSANLANGCIDVVGSSTAASANLEQNTCTGGANQVFAVSVVSAAPLSPSITAQPASQTVTAGQTASFSVAATGTAPLSYQWKKNGTAISGATSSSYTTAATATSDNGGQFTVAVSNSAGSATSNVATLTVTSSGGAVPAAGSVVSLQNANSKLCIDTGGSTGFTYLIQSACSTNKSQQFTLTAAPTSGWYYLTSMASNLCWDMWNGSSSVGALLQQYTCTAVSPEYYQLKAVSGGYEILSRNLANGCIGVVGGSFAAGANLEQNTCAGAANQVFAASVVNPAGTPTQSQISVAPASVSFANVAIGTANTQTIKLSNSGTANLTISQATVSGSAFSTSGLTLPLTLSPGQSTNFSVAFAPAGVSSVSGSVSLVGNAPNSPLAITLSGTGVATTSLLGTNPTSLSFGSVNVSGNSSLGATLTNNGNSNVTISTVTVSGAGFSASGVSAGTTLTPNQSVTLNVSFAPTAVGSLLGSVTVVSDASNSPTTIPLSGIGAALTTINVTAFGATGNGSTDDTAAINSAIAALQPGYELFFPCGTYKISAGLTSITKNNLTIDGQTGCAAGRVVIRSTGGGSTILQVGSQSLSSPTPITATTADLDQTFQANFSAIGAGIGDYVYLEEAVSTSDPTHSNCGGSGCRGEVLKITGLNGNTATLETAVHHAYDPSCCVPWVQKLLNPVSGVTLRDLALDGSGTATYALAVLDAVNLTVTNLTAQNVSCSAIAAVNGYNDSYANITITHAGTNNGCNIGGSAVSLQQQGNLNVNGVSISNMNVGGFGFIPFREANGTFSNISVDGTGTGSGRLFKTNSAAHNVFNNISTNRDEGAYYQGITIEYFSHHNVWNNCKVTNNVSSSGANNGINLYGDVANGNHQGGNHYNTFNNCTVTGNNGSAIFVSDNNNNLEINGGTYSAVAGLPVIDIGSPCCANNAYIHNASIGGPGSIGIYIENGSASACINNNTFAPGLSTSIDVTASSDIGSGNVLNGLFSNLTPGSCGAGLP